MQAGDTVNYVPAQVHARQRDRDGQFPWVFGWKTGRRVKNNDGVASDEVIEMTNQEVFEKLKHIRMQAPERAEREAAKLVFLRPGKPWKALVKAINLASTPHRADLDITDPTTGATLHYDDVPITSDHAPHTCYE